MKLLNKCKTCEFGHYTFGAHDKLFYGVYIECLHWDRPGNPFYIKAIDPTPKNCPKKEHIGFCLREYEKESCHDCPTLTGCLELRDKEIA